MLQFKKTREVLYPLTVALLSEETPGEVVEHTFSIRYQLLTKEEYRAGLSRVMEDIGEADVNEPARTVAHQLSKEKYEKYDQFIMDHVVGFGDDLIDDTTSEPMVFSKENLLALMDSAIIAKAIDEGLWIASRDVPAKNS